MLSMITLISNMMFCVKYNKLTFICVYRFGAANPVVLFANAGKGHSAGLVDCSICQFYLLVFRCNNVYMWQSLI